jgi:hypothetical protein
MYSSDSDTKLIQISILNSHCIADCRLKTERRHYTGEGLLQHTQGRKNTSMIDTMDATGTTESPTMMEENVMNPVQVKTEWFENAFKKTQREMTPPPGSELIQDRHKWIERLLLLRKTMQSQGKSAVVISHELVKARKTWLEEQQDKNDNRSVTPVQRSDEGKNRMSERVPAEEEVTHSESLTGPNGNASQVEVKSSEKPTVVDASSPQHADDTLENTEAPVKKAPAGNGRLNARENDAANEPTECTLDTQFDEQQIHDMPTDERLGLSGGFILQPQGRNGISPRQETGKGKHPLIVTNQSDGFVVDTECLDTCAIL